VFLVLAKLPVGHGSPAVSLRCRVSHCVFVMLNLRVLLLASQVRHMSLSELGATDEMLKVSASAFLPYPSPQRYRARNLLATSLL
jgi:hypothetical protein